MQLINGFRNILFIDLNFCKTNSVLLIENGGANGIIFTIKIYTLEK